MRMRIDYIYSPLQTSLPAVPDFSGVSTRIGGYHLVSLAFAAATTCWALAMLRAPKGWPALGYAGFIVAAGSIVSSYPDLIGPMLVFVLEAALAFWWVAVGLRLRKFDDLPKAPGT